MSALNRTIQDRCFVVVLSLVVMIPTGWGLWICFTRDRSGDSPHWISKLLSDVAVEILGMAFLLSALGVVWAVLMPGWMERIARFVIDHFVWALAVLLWVMVLFAWFTVYVRW